MKRTRRKHSPEFKAKVALATLKGDRTLPPHRCAAAASLGIGDVIVNSALPR